MQYATTLAYDPLNRPTQVSWDPVATQTASTAGSVTFTHGYNAANQRISQGVTDNTWIGYPSSASGTTYTANALNQYTSVGTITPTYDQNGNLVVADTFDAVPTATAGTTNYVTDPEQRMVLEYNGTSGAITNWYAYGLGSNEVLNRMDVAGGTRQTLIPDSQGSTVATLDSGGTLTKRTYLPFGEGSTSAGTFAYTGQYLDSSGLYNYRARAYSSALGRFLQPDPIGYAGGRNLLAYVGNDPLNRIDPNGEFSIPFGFAVGGAAVGLAAQTYSDYQTGFKDATVGKYLGAATSGALGGIALMTGGGLATTVTYGAGAAFVGNSVQQFTDRATGSQSSYSITSAIAATIAGGVASALLKPFAGTLESHYAPIAQGLLTKYINGTISQAAPKTVVKMVGARMLSDNTVPGGLLEDPIKEGIINVIGGSGATETASPTTAPGK